MKTIKLISCIFLIFCLGCKKYLDLKPDKNQAVPATLKDCQSLLNNAGVLGPGFPFQGEISSDDFYLLPQAYNTLAPQFRDPYIWKSDAQIFSSAWSNPYNKVLVANQVLAVLSDITPTNAEQATFNQIKGAALLLRSTAFLSLASLFTQPYDGNTASTDLGIPIKLTPSISEEVSRGTVQQTYNRIVEDFTQAAELLPLQEPFSPATRSTAMPVRAAALAALARAYLVMGNYEMAYTAADNSLQQYNQLMDFNSIDPNQYYSFARFNDEVLYETSVSAYVPASLGLVSPQLYQLYTDGDLRKVLFFRSEGDGTYRYKGGYNPEEIFNGYATNENYLIRAECAARTGHVDMAVADLNVLRKKRWDKDLYMPLTAANAAEALRLVLLERRKELPFTTLRWMDLRRLNKDPKFAETLKRTLNGETYTLAPNDLRYTFLIPREVLQRTNMPQNPR